MTRARRIVIPNRNDIRQGRTLAIGVYTNLRDSILTGGLKPGSRLSPSVLATKYGVSTTVVREALTRLSSEHLAQALPQQGFTVIAATREELADLTRVRTLIDTEALRLSIARNNVSWQGRVLAAHHMMSRSSPKSNAAVSDSFAEAHRHFHETLVSGCGSDRLISLSQTLFNETEVYRRLLRRLASVISANADEHQGILDATLSGNAKEAVRLLSKHYVGMANILLKSDLLVGFTSQVDIS